MRPEREARLRRVVAVFWPSFLMAAAAAFLVFTVFEPNFQVICGPAHDPDEQLGVYTLTFFGFWGMGALVGALALYFAKPCRTTKPTSDPKSDAA